MGHKILRFKKRMFDGTEGLEEAILADSIVRVEQCETHVRIEYTINQGNIQSVYITDAYDDVIARWNDALLMAR